MSHNDKLSILAALTRSALLHRLQLNKAFLPCVAYDASGGGGIADTHDLGGGRLHVKFDAKTLYIPDVYYKTAKFLGAPMVPPFRIKINPVKLEVLCALHGHTQCHLPQCFPYGGPVQGEINRTTGEAALEFIANFMFTAGPFYKVLC